MTVLFLYPLTFLLLGEISKFNGVKKENFVLHLKESEFRWNYRGQNLYQILLKNFREKPL